jgi:hypothetical protein
MLHKLAANSEFFMSKLSDCQVSLLCYMIIAFELQMLTVKKGTYK